MASKPAEPVATEHQKTGVIPLSIVSPVDVGRLIRELDIYDDAMEQKRLRGAKDAPVEDFKTSKLLQATAELNKLDLSQASSRKNLKKFLTEVRAQAPVLHMSFSADPTGVFIEKLMTWLRREIHPTVLLTIGLQPSIGAGCIVRSTNKYFDFSLRKDFDKKSDVFIKALQEAK